MSWTITPSYTLYPPLLPGVVAWWDASDASTFTFSSGNVVQGWRSLVGNYTLTQAIVANRPARSGTINGRASVVFDGSNDSLSVANFDLTAGGQAFSVWTVFTAASGGDQVVVEQSSNYNSNPGAFLLIRNSTGNFPSLSKRAVSATYATFDCLTPIATQPAVFVGIHNGNLSTNETSAWVNGSGAGTRIGNADTNSSNLSATLFIGSRAGSSLFLSGQIAELGFTTNAMADSDRLLLQQYLAAKWGTP